MPITIASPFTKPSITGWGTILINLPNLKIPDNICKIFEEKDDWYFDAKDAQEKWGSPKHVLMAMMYQESSFRHNAKPHMDYLLGFIPIGRVSSAYGYSQAKTLTWAD